LETIKKKYERRESRYNQLLQKQKKTDRRISNLRPAVFFTGIGAAVLVNMVHNYILLTAILVLFAAIFIYLVVRHERLKNHMRYTTFLRDINTRSITSRGGKDAAPWESL
jgi:Flp pilus assembly protein TadB